VSSPVDQPGSYGAPPSQYASDYYRGDETGFGSHPVETTTEAPQRSLGEIVSGITADLSTLMQQEVALAKAEATQSAKRVSKGAGMFAGAGFAGYFVLLFLSIALWWALGVHTGQGWSGLIVALLWAIVGAVLALRGKKELADVRGLDRTTETLGKIPNAVKGHEEQNR
jgi:hypothetical protein